MTEFRCGPYVTRQIGRLLGTDPSRLRPQARGWLASLRTASAAEPGTAPDVWKLTAEGIPEGLPEAQYRRIENALHVALTQFAIHQQARPRSMHDPDVPFGRAIRKLAQTNAGDSDVHETPVYRRFTALALASTMTGLVTHARGLVTLLRSQEIPFDYGRFADDLYRFQVPGRRSGVQRRWGRDFHHLSTADLDLAHPNATALPANEGDN